jgi:hypothetical protein
MLMGYSVDPSKGHSGQFANNCAYPFDRAHLRALSFYVYQSPYICKSLRNPGIDSARLGIIPGLLTNMGFVSVTVKWWLNFDINILADCFCYLEYREEIKYLVRMFNTKEKLAIIKSPKRSLFSIFENTYDCVLLLNLVLHDAMD